MKKVLAFFGAFNPPTTAHLELADFARKATAASSRRTGPTATRFGWKC